MPTNYSGDPANVTTPLAATVIGCSSGASSRVRVQTSAAHNYATNDYVAVSGVVGTTEANTTAKINVIDSTHFDMIGTTFSNAYVSGGTCSDLSLTPYGQFADDGEPGTVASIEAFLQMLADRTQYLALLARVLAVQVVTSTRALVAPLGATMALVDMHGGGGGGGGGASGTIGTSAYSLSGGGGGGAKRCLALVPVTALTSYTMTVGAAGAGGGIGAAGTDGGDTTFGSLATAPGAAGGRGGVSMTNSGTPTYTLGGAPGGPAATAIAVDNTLSSGTTMPAGFAYNRQPGEGGFGLPDSNNFNSSNVGNGMGNGAGFAGGARGADGTKVTAYHAGGGGGGGGGGPAAVGGAGGHGGGGQTGGGGGTATGGTSGTSAAANSGAGGGGGGAGGNDSTLFGGGGSGGNGGTGGGTVYWLR